MLASQEAALPAMPLHQTRTFLVINAMRHSGKGAAVRFKSRLCIFPSGLGFSQSRFTNELTDSSLGLLRSFLTFAAWVPRLCRWDLVAPQSSVVKSAIMSLIKLIFSCEGLLGAATHEVHRLSRGRGLFLCSLS